ncbi:MAG: FimV/HubP family polar landmark protein, partial [Thalassotalea sp.]
IVEVADNAELTDPDDIDALMDSMAAESAEPEKTSTEPEAEIVEVADNAELTDPDDIDALMDSMAAESMAEELSTPVESERVEVDDKIEKPSTEAIEHSKEGDSITDENKQEGDVLAESEHKVLIDNFTEDYISPLLSTDFSDLLSQQEDEKGLDPDNDELSSDTQTIAEDDIDIDELLSEIENTELEHEAPLNDVEQSEKSLEEVTSDDVLEDISAEFDESTLADLLNDEAPSNEAVELAPDFNDSDVLADLLSDADDPAENSAVEANEIDDIKELDNLDFDELLANIEEEAPASLSDDFDLDTELDIGDDLGTLPENIEQVEQNLTTTEDDFVSVDSLLSDSLDAETSEPYDTNNIDVGLNEFPEFSVGANELDVDDEDDSGIAAKLDLAKVYIEIGDAENAEVILKEVAGIGDEQQQLEAQQLLGDLNK